MKVAMANDHAGTRMKNEINKQLESMGHEVVDFGTYDENAADLPVCLYSTCSLSFPPNSSKWD